jgi:hypothetical protein
MACIWRILPVYVRVSQDPDAYFAGSSKDPQMTQLIGKKKKKRVKAVLIKFEVFATVKIHAFFSWSMTLL